MLGGKGIVTLLGDRRNPQNLGTQISFGRIFALTYQNSKFPMSGKSFTLGDRS